MNTINLTHLKTCTDLREKLQQSEAVLQELEQPYITDRSLIPIAHGILLENLAGQDRLTQLRAETLIMLYLFAPSVLTKPHAQTDKTFAAIYDTMQIKRSNAYFYKRNVLFFYSQYSEFQKVVDEGLECVVRNLRV